MELTPRLTEGLTLFNSGKFFEAHERWEDVWRTLQGEEKTYVQGLIQVAAAMAKLRMDPEAWEGALYLMDKGIKKIGASPGFKGKPERLAAFVEIRNRVVAEQIDLADLPELRLQ